MIFGIATCKFFSLFSLIVNVIAGENSTEKSESEEKKFVMEHPIAAFHVAISQTKKERVNVFNQVGPYRRALCARRDLQIRNLLCKPVNKVSFEISIQFYLFFAQNGTYPDHEYQYIALKSLTERETYPCYILCSRTYIKKFILFGGREKCI